ncbi:hypothetical protein OnM2_095010, partial [Erysiphe neolycopersici]
IPVLKTTIIIESHWRKVKHDFLHRFSCPRIDLVSWVTTSRVAPQAIEYASELDITLIDSSLAIQVQYSARSLMRRDWYIKIILRSFDRSSKTPGTVSRDGKPSRDAFNTAEIYVWSVSTAHIEEEKRRVKYL